MGAGRALRCAQDPCRGAKVLRQWHDKSPWLCPWRELSSTVGIPRGWLRAQMATNNQGQQRDIKFPVPDAPVGCKLLSWQHRARGSLPEYAAASFFPWGSRRRGKILLKTPTLHGKPCSEWGRQWDPLLCLAEGPGRPSHTSPASPDPCTSPPSGADLSPSLSPWAEVQ